VNTSNEILVLLTQGMREILPLTDLQAVITLSEKNLENGFSLADILVDFENKYGTVSANGLFFRSGGAAFKYLVWKFGKKIEIDSLNFRLQPQQKRLLDGCKKLISLLEKWKAAKFSLTQSDGLTEIVMKRTKSYEFASTDRIWLHFIAGMFQELLFWAGGGKHYPFQIIVPDNEQRQIVIQFRMLQAD
jgi:hypothetical protein